MSGTSFKNLHPTEDRLLIRPEAISEVSEGGIYIPNAKKNRRSSGRGTVLAKGPGRLINGDYVTTACNVGDVVVFGEYAGSEIRHNDEDLLLMNWVEILAVFPVKQAEPQPEPVEA